MDREMEKMPEREPGRETEWIADAEKPSLPARTGGNESTGWIKLIAVAFMLVDHVSVVFFPRVYELRLLGRTAFPLFAWCICVGAVYTRNIWKYALRLLIVGIIAQPCFMLGLAHGWKDLNVYATLLLGLLGIAAVREKRYGSQWWGPALVLLTACVFKMDYGWKGVLLILLLYAARKNRASIAAVMIAFCLYWGQGYMSLQSLLGVQLVRSVSFPPYTETLLPDLWRIQFWGILALPFMIIPMKRRLRLPKWVFYGAYPFHLLALGIIRNWQAIAGFLGIS